MNGQHCIIYVAFCIAPLHEPTWTQCQLNQNNTVTSTMVINFDTYTFHIIGVITPHQTPGIFELRSVRQTVALQFLVVLLLEFLRMKEYFVTKTYFQLKVPVKSNDSKQQMIHNMSLIKCGEIINFKVFSTSKSDCGTVSFNISSIVD